MIGGFFKSTRLYIYIFLWCRRLACWTERTRDACTTTQPRRPLRASVSLWFLTPTARGFFRFSADGEPGNRGRKMIGKESEYEHEKAQRIAMDGLLASAANISSGSAL